MHLRASPALLALVVLTICSVATTRAEGAPVECAACELVLNTAAKFGGNASSIADAIAHLAQDCDKIFGTEDTVVIGVTDDRLTCSWGAIKLAAGTPAVTLSPTA